MDTEKIKKIQKTLKPILIIPSIAYGAVVNTKHLLYDSKLLKSEQYENVKIISVGNISVGGVGKTPIVIKIAQALTQYGKTCVITSNYPSKDKRVHVVSIEGNIFKKQKSVSDETLMIAQKTTASVIASKDRKAAIELAIGLNMKYVILDDALHKRNIKKDFEICVVDKENPFEDNLYLPAGFLRDAKSSIKRCNVVICIDKTGYKEKKINCLEGKIKTTGIFDNKHKQLNHKPSAFLFCGIGKPLSFLKSAKEYGIEIKGYKFFKDHYWYKNKDIEELRKLRNLNKADILLTTHKDFVKINAEDIYYLDIDLEIENFKQLVGELI